MDTRVQTHTLTSAHLNKHTTRTLGCPVCVPRSPACNKKCNNFLIINNHSSTKQCSFQRHLAECFPSNTQTQWKVYITAEIDLPPPTCPCLSITHSRLAHPVSQNSQQNRTDFEIYILYRSFVMRSQRCVYRVF